MDSSFDPAAFLQSTTTEVNEEREKIPVGWYTAQIGEIDSKNAKSGTIGKGDRLGDPWLMIRVPLKLQLPAEVQAKGLPAEFQLTDSVFIDLTPQGSVDNSKGKNPRQRIYRDAAGLNKPGEPFSWQMLMGRPVKVEVKHKVLPDGRIIEEIGNILGA